MSWEPRARKSGGVRRTDQNVRILAHAADKASVRAQRLQKEIEELGEGDETNDMAELKRKRLQDLEQGYSKIAKQAMVWRTVSAATRIQAHARRRAAARQCQVQLAPVQMIQQKESPSVVLSSTRVRLRWSLFSRLRFPWRWRPARSTARLQLSAAHGEGVAQAALSAKRGGLPDLQPVPQLEA